MLFERYSGKIYDSLLPVEMIRPYPAASDRGMWERTDAGTKVLINERAGRYGGPGIGPLKGTDILDACKSGDTGRIREHFDKAINAVTAYTVAGCMDGDDGYAGKVLDAAWTLLDMAVWYLPSGKSDAGDPYDIRKPVIDIYSARTGFVLSYIYYLFRDKFDEYDINIGKRFRFELKRRIMKPFIETVPENSIAPGCLPDVVFPFLIFDEGYETRHEAVRKSMEAADNDLHWSDPAALLKFLDIMHMASEGIFDVYDESEIVQMVSSRVDKGISDRETAIGLLQYAYNSRDRGFSKRLFSKIRGREFIGMMREDIPLDQTLFLIFNREYILNEFYCDIKGNEAIYAEG